MRVFVAACGGAAVVLGLAISFAPKVSTTLGVAVVVAGALFIAASAALQRIPMWIAPSSVLLGIAGSAVGLTHRRWVLGHSPMEAGYAYGYPFGWLRHLDKVPMDAPPQLWQSLFSPEHARWDVNVPPLLADLGVWGSAGLILLIGAHVVSLLLFRRRTVLDSGLSRRFTAATPPASSADSEHRQP